MTHSNPSRAWTWVLGVLILVDLVFAFVQFGRFPLDGDISSVVVPSEAYGRILADPFGFALWQDRQPYYAPNRYFAHAGMRAWFLHAPAWFRGLADPVDAVYAACALLKWLVQFALLYLLAALVSGRKKLTDGTLLAAAFCIAPLFQNYGFNTSMGVIDRAITYTCFYALPSVVLMYYLLLQRRAKPGSFSQRILLILLPVLIPFHGPLSPALGLLLSTAHFVERGLWSRRKQPDASAVQLLHGWSLSWALLGGLSLYSLVLGSFNAENLVEGPSIAARYVLLGKGLAGYFFGHPSLIIVLSAVLVGFFHARIRGALHEEVKRYFLLSALLVCGYLLLLPWGGYRPYRPMIVRIDTLQPAILWLFGWFGFFASRSLVALLRAGREGVGGIVVLVILIYFTVADASLMKMNREERRYLHELMDASTPVVRLPDDQPVMAWSPVRTVEESRLNCMLLHEWGVIPADRRYFQAGRTIE